MKNLILCVLLSTAAFAQSPLKTIGKYTCYKQAGSNGMTRITGAGPVAIQNVSPQNIVALVVKFDASCGLVGSRMVYTHDMIFKANGIPPKGKLDLPVAADEAYSVEVEYHEGTLKVEPIFVQFEDGSSWGDATYLKAFSEDRADAIAYINTLNSITDKGQFSAALDEPINSDGDKRAIQGHLKLMLQQDGLAAVKAMIAERLNTYNSRIANGHF